MTQSTGTSVVRCPGRQSTYSPSIIDTCLKQSELDSCAKFTQENRVDLARCNALYDVAKKVRFGQFSVDFTELGASIEDSHAINQLYRLGLNFHQLTTYLQAKHRGSQ